MNEWQLVSWGWRVRERPDDLWFIGQVIGFRSPSKCNGKSSKIWNGKWYGLIYVINL